MAKSECLTEGTKVVHIELPFLQTGEVLQVRKCDSFGQSTSYRYRVKFDAKTTSMWCTAKELRKV